MPTLCSLLPRSQRDVHPVQRQGDLLARVARILNKIFGPTSWSTLALLRIHLKPFVRINVTIACNSLFTKNLSQIMRAPTSLDPTLSKLERFELFSTQQAYYIVACDKNNNKYRVLKIDRTLIPSNQEQQHVGESNTTEGSVSSEQQNTATTSPGDGPSLDSIENSVYNNRPLSSFCVEDPHVYNQEEIQEMLDMIHNGNKNVGGLRPICKAYGIVGIIRFLDCYYLTLITKRVKVGSIGGCAIYSIKSTETFPLKAAEMQSSRPGSADSNMNVGGGADPSSMLLSLWNHGKRSVGLGLTNREIAELRYQGLYQVIDMSKNFFFSYNYDMTRSLQDNFLSFTSKPFPPPPQKDMFSWNFFLTRELEECTTSLTSSYWILPIVHGAFSQRKINDYGRTLNLTLMARRSRHFAGTRYLKRGVSDRGKVANDVEHEQILHDETLSGSKGTFSSFIQMRGECKSTYIIIYFAACDIKSLLFHIYYSL